MYNTKQKYSITGDGGNCFTSRNIQYYGGSESLVPAGAVGDISLASGDNSPKSCSVPLHAVSHAVNAVMECAGKPDTKKAVFSALSLYPQEYTTSPWGLRI